ncbi:hypothetical protein M8A51_24695 [Schlegelella sp. S2-27]|uniref:Uncharacterized protein n=1 Tax=Caldimonas mangrovi TaxID=2944811 RepID=A0ABT0YY31_9BURK|nr:hypothetical protein [Caldimonas mangrovi]MCM5682743.1 hypothetical protein [Caldimonas mangrovi]
MSTVFACSPSTRWQSGFPSADKHVVFDGRDVTQTITVPGIGSYSVSSVGTGLSSISHFGGVVAASIHYSSRTGAVIEVSATLNGIRQLAGLKVGVTLKTSLRPISFNNQIVFNGSFTAEVSIFGKSIYSQTKARPIGLHDSVDALSVLSIGFLDPEANPNIKAFLERLKRTKEGDLPGMNSLTREELAALLALLKQSQMSGA